jgi:hypothetical protein
MVVPLKPIRSNVATVSDAERAKLRDAILALNTSKYPDLVSYWFKQDQIHQATHVHRGAAFLPWHRELVNRFEALLQEVDPTVALHYWDWQTDPRSSPNGQGGTTDLFTADFMGSPGQPDQEEPVGKPFDKVSGFDNGGVDAGSRDFQPDPKLPPRQITRQVAAGTPRNFGFLNPETGRMEHHDIGSDEDILDEGGSNAEEYKNMRLRLEKEHNWVHGYIGGNIGKPGFHQAFEDPFVFLLHSNVDRLWASWQLRTVGDSRDVSRRLEPEQVYGSEGGDLAITEELHPWAGPWDGIAIRPWAPPENQKEVKTSKDPSIVRPPLYDNYVLAGSAGASWEAMLLGSKLPDGDIIQATIAYDVVSPATVEFVLESASQINWWKAIDVPDAPPTRGVPVG